MKSNYICKIPNIDEMNIKWDYEINHSGEDRNNWIVWKKNNIKNFKKGYIVPYYGILEGIIICEATAIINPKVVQNSDGLVGEDIAYLSAFRMIPEFQGQGYFSILFRYMVSDLKKKGYLKLTLGVEPGEVKNKQIYNHYGFTEYIKTGYEIYPDGTVIEVEYYLKYI